MGRGRILSGGDEGRYQVELDIGEARLAGRVQQYQLMIDALQPVLDEYQQRINQAKTGLQAAVAVLDEQIAAYDTAMRDPEAPAKAREEARKAVDQATQNVMQHRATVQANETLLATKKLEKAGLEQKRAQLASVPGTRQVSAWCADLTEDGTGEVGTIEVPGEPAEVLVAPGARAPIFWDGALLARPAMNGPQAYFNAAILPGWQRHRPTYRFGVASNIDPVANTMTVTLLPASSSAQRLDVNDRTVLEDVPVTYMTCNAGAFEDDDEVVVQFASRDWSDPRVIGFRKEPKPCSWSAWYGTWNGAIHYIDGHEGAARYFEGEISEYGAYWNGTPIGAVTDTDNIREWSATEPGDGSQLTPGIEIQRNMGVNAYLTLRPLILRASGGGTVSYTMTGVNEFRLVRAGRTLFHYAYEVANGYSGSVNPNIVCRPFLVGGLAIKEPRIDEQPFLPKVDGLIPGWTPSA